MCFAIFHYFFVLCHLYPPVHLKKIHYTIFVTLILSFHKTSSSMRQERTFESFCDSLTSNSERGMLNAFHSSPHSQVGLSLYKI